MGSQGVPLEMFVRSAIVSLVKLLAFSSEVRSSDITVAGIARYHSRPHHRKGELGCQSYLHGFSVVHLLCIFLVIHDDLKFFYRMGHKSTLARETRGYHGHFA